MTRALAGADADLVDSVELLVSEVVTNAVLHAHTDIGLTVTPEPDGSVRVEIRDGSMNLPLPRDYSPTASTGRGLGMVEVLASSYGVDAHPAGKTVWFVVGGGYTPDLGEWGLDDDLLPAAPEPPRDAGDVEVWLRGLPVALYQVLQQQNDALLREYALVRSNISDGEPAPDMAAAERAHGLLALAVSTTAENDPGADRVDVRLDVPPESIPDFSELRSCLGSAVNLALAGLLLTRPALPEVRALRSWCLEQVSEAAAGGVNRPWVSVVYEDDDVALDPGAYDTTALRGAKVAMVAADDRNRIVALNAEAARLLRWTAQELVGHRLVAIIPSRLRDAHVAGFSRHLLTGETRILGSPIRVPVLRGDSSEILLDLLLTAEPAPSGRSLYFGRFTEPEESPGATPTLS